MINLGGVGLILLVGIATGITLERQCTHERAARERWGSTLLSSDIMQNVGRRANELALNDNHELADFLSRAWAWLDGLHQWDQTARMLPLPTRDGACHLTHQLKQ